MAMPEPSSVEALASLVLAVETTGAPDPSLIDALFEMSIDIYGNVVQGSEHGDAFRLILLLFPSLSLSSQLAVLGKFERLAATSFANLAALTDDDLGLIPFLVSLASGQTETAATSDAGAGGAIASLLSALLLYDVRVADVTALLRALKPTARGFRPPGRNHVLATLTAVLGKPEDPPVFWAFDGRDSGLVLPDLAGWPTAGYSVGLWLRVEEFLGGSRVFSFLSDSGAGFEACFAKPDAAEIASGAVDANGFVLVVRSISTKGKDNYEAGKFVFSLGTWYHVVVTHLSKTFSRSAVNIYANGELVDTLAVKYPSLKHVPMTQCSLATNVAAIGAGRAAHSLHGQLGPGYLFARALTASEVALLYALGPARVVAFPLAGDASSSGAAASAAWPASGLPPSGLLFAFHPRGSESSLSTTVYNLAQRPDTLVNQDAHGALLRGSELMSGTRLRHVFNAVGGLSLLLPLFGQLDLPPAPSDASGALGPPLTEVDGAALWALVAQLAIRDRSAQLALATPPTMRLIGYLLTTCAPAALGAILLPTLPGLLDFAAAAAPPLRFELLDKLLLPGTLWSHVPDDAMRARNALISVRVKASPAYFRAAFGVGYFLDAIADAYLDVPERALARLATSSGAAPPLARSPDMLRDTRRALLKSIKNMVAGEHLDEAELGALLRFLITVNDPEALVEVLQLVLVLVLSGPSLAEWLVPVSPPPRALVALFATLDRLLSAEASVRTGLFALKVALAIFVALARASSPKKLARFVAATGFGPAMLEPALRTMTFSPLAYNILMAAVLGDVSLHLQETALTPGVPVVLPSLLPMVLDLVARSTSARIKEQALQDLLLLARYSAETRASLIQMAGWEAKLAGVVMASVLNTAAAAPELGSEAASCLDASALARNVVFELGVNVFFLLLRDALVAKGGARAVERSYSALLAFAAATSSGLAPTFVHSLLTALFIKLLSSATQATEAVAAVAPGAGSAASSGSNPFAEADHHVAVHPGASALGVELSGKALASLRENMPGMVALVEELVFAFPFVHMGSSATPPPTYDGSTGASSAVPPPTYGGGPSRSQPAHRASDSSIPRDAQGRWILYEVACAAVDAALAVLVPLPPGAVTTPPVATLGEGVARGLGRLLVAAMQQVDFQFPDDSRLMQLQNELLTSAVTLGTPGGSASKSTAVALHDYSKAGELHRVVYSHLRSKLAARSKEARRKTSAYERLLRQGLVLMCGCGEASALAAGRVAPAPALSGMRKGVVAQALSFALTLLVAPATAFQAEEAIQGVTHQFAVGVAAVHRPSLVSLDVDVRRVDWRDAQVSAQVAAFCAAVGEAVDAAGFEYGAAVGETRHAAMRTVQAEASQAEAVTWKEVKLASALTSGWLGEASAREAQRRALHCHALVYDARDAARVWASVFKTLTLSTASWAVPRSLRKFSLDLRERPNRVRIRLVLDDQVPDHSPALISSRTHGGSGGGDNGPGTSSEAGGGADDAPPTYEALEGLVINSAYDPATGLSSGDKDSRVFGDDEAGPADDDEAGPSDGVPQASRFTEDSLVLVPARVITGFVEVPGEFELTSSRMFFRTAHPAADEALASAVPEYLLASGSLRDELLRDRAWEMDALAKVHGRRVLLRPRGLELFFVDGSSVLLGFDTEGDRKTIIRAVSNLKPRNLVEVHAVAPALLAKAAKVTEAWVAREISNFDYLMALNTLAGRSYHDLSQYPVFPWVLADYESEKLSLDDHAVYRDLSKPIGALDAERLAYFEERYASLEEADPSVPAFHYGSHYSSPGVVLYYLARLEPYTSMFAHFNGGKFDHADRMFHSMARTFSGVLHSTADVKELIPEFYYLPEMFENVNEVDFGVRQDGVRLDNVILPPWAETPQEFVAIHRRALESEYVSQHLHEWIDLIFGCKQWGEAAVEARNVFHYMTYEGVVDLEAIDDPMQLAAAEAQIANFGQTPSRLFDGPHPARGPRTVGPGRELVPRVNPARLSSYLGDGPVRVSAVPVAAALGLVVRTPSALRGTTAVQQALVVVNVDQEVVVAVAEPPSSERVAPQVVVASEAAVPLGRSLAQRIGAGAGGRLGQCVVAVDAHAFANTRTVASSAAFPAVTRVPRSSRSKLDGCPEVVISCGHWDNTLTVTAIKGDGGARVLQRVSVGMDSVIQCVAASRSGGLVATGCAQSQVLVWSLAPGAHPSGAKRGTVLAAHPHAMLYGHESGVVAVAVESSLDAVVSGASDGRVLMHSLSDGEVMHELVGAGGGAVAFVGLSALSHAVSYHAETGAVRVFAYNGELLCEEELSSGASAMLLSCDGRYLYLASDEGEVEVRALPLLDLVHVYDAVSTEIVSVVEDSSGEYVYAVASDGRVMVGGVAEWQ
ncbi:uncharacterized protein AMSG_07209 [Thecamonas trahens ATCC 50062]|uniref:Beige/BEACH domain-containing protein n=1 Tax=Thecamonas trahens ATCC 50062 TaxID=461836 RepID=A0A0L0DFF3_THETB|nr:hypothetical protein AMSG_07209 [Thecamonas trahens ATCC 50062]KNC50955.1 hypothetical protein AMSG_07209 [Thecamonas trahens ATCC 50062]|eukprot:XP_013756651.1 hypothetical protein AMSG_07209 [Thecamonas trahens ATCC 50062]